MIYELRVYRAMPGRLPKVIARFKDHTTGIWDRLGIKHVGFWTTLIGESEIGDLTYLLTLPGHGFYWFQLPPVAADR